MKTRATLHFTTIQPDLISEWVEDEPYLWTWFWKLDGDTVRQVAPEVNSLLGSVIVHSHPGSHGNLPKMNEDDIGLVRSRRFSIAAEQGRFSADLRPIRLRLNGTTYLIPGQLWCFSALMEEDESSDNAMEAASQEMFIHIEQTLNAAIASLAPAVVRNTVAATQPLTPVAWSTALADTFMGIFDTVAAGFGQKLRDLVNQHASNEESLLDPSSWDWDECQGTFVFRMDEIRLRALPVHDVAHQFVALDSEGDWYSLYTMRGTITGQPVGSDVFLEAMGGTSQATPVKSGTLTTSDDLLCLPAGTVVKWEALEEKETEDFLLLAPYGPVAWFLHTAPLTEAGATVQAVSILRPRRIPRFDFSAPGWVRYDAHNALVEVSYVFNREPQGTRLQLSNRPDDGSYECELTVRRPGDKNAPTLAATLVAFSGLSIRIPAWTAFQRCLREKFEWVDRKRIPRPMPRGPGARRKLFDELMSEGRLRVRAGLLSPVRLREVEAALERRLKLQPPPQRPAMELPASTAVASSR